MASAKKELKVVSDPTSNLYEVKFVGGGELPIELKTKFTSTVLAEQWITKYYDNTFKKLRAEKKKDTK